MKPQFLKKFKYYENYNSNTMETTVCSKKVIFLGKKKNKERKPAKSPCIKIPLKIYKHDLLGLHR